MEVRIFNEIIFQIRIMKDRDTGESKGYAFIAFKTKEVAQKAIEELHSKEFKVIMVLVEFFLVAFCRLFQLGGYLYYIPLLQGKTLRCSLSETKHRLFIGNVPKTWTEDDFRKVIEEVGPGVENIELIKVELYSIANFYFYFFC